MLPAQERKGVRKSNELAPVGVSEPVRKLRFSVS